MIKFLFLACGAMSLGNIFLGCNERSAIQMGRDTAEGMAAGIPYGPIGIAAGGILGALGLLHPKVVRRYKKKWKTDAVAKGADPTKLPD